MPGLFSISQDPALSMAPERHRQLPRGGDTQVCLGCMGGCRKEETCLEQGPEGRVDALNRVSSSCHFQTPIWRAGGPCCSQRRGDWCQMPGDGRAGLVCVSPCVCS